MAKSLSSYTAAELFVFAREAEKREAEGDYRHRKVALIDALSAAVFCVQNPPSGTIGEHQLKKASRLVYELTYMTLPGGRLTDGMDGGWRHVGRDQDEVLELLVPQHADGHGAVPRLEVD